MRSVAERVDVVVNRRVGARRSRRPSPRIGVVRGHPGGRSRARPGPRAAGGRGARSPRGSVRRMRAGSKLTLVRVPKSAPAMNIPASRLPASPRRAPRGSAHASPRQTREQDVLKPRRLGVLAADAAGRAGAAPGGLLALVTEHRSAPSCSSYKAFSGPGARALLPGNVAAQSLIQVNREPSCAVLMPVTHAPDRPAELSLPDPALREVSGEHSRSRRCCTCPAAGSRP